MYNTKFNILPILIATITLAFSCKNNRLPQVEYAEKLNNQYICAILNYYDGYIRDKDSIIDDFNDFNLSCREKLPEMDHILQWLYAISIDKNTKYFELDSVFRVIANSRNFKIFLLVNDIKDTLGFTMGIYQYYKSYPHINEKLDTFFLDNLIMLKQNQVFINGKNTIGREINSGIREIVFKKERVALVIDKITKYETIVDILSIYNFNRQHFKELYSELIFNKNYTWLIENGLYKQEVDEEYRSQIFFLDTSNISDMTIIVKDKNSFNYVP